MGRIVMLSQSYPPDVQPAGQLFESAALLRPSGFGGRALHGQQVTVYAGREGYYDHTQRFDGRSASADVRVVRLRWSSFGTRSLGHRLLGQFCYLTQVFFRLLFARGVDGIVVGTIPPTVASMVLVLRAFRQFPVLYWLMEVNPDRSVAMGTLREGGFIAGWLERTNGRMVRTADAVVVMDRYMRKVVLRKNWLQDDECGKVETIPPWPLQEHLRPVPRAENTFITAHHLEDKRCIFMYSGKHSLQNPLGTLLAAIRRKRGRDDLAFLFVGGGRGKAAVDAFAAEEQAHGNACVRSLPFQPLETLSFSLSAADVQIVVMGEHMVGIVHPSKIYSAMAVGRPVLFIGPRQSHHGELVALCGFGWVVEHGDVDRLERVIDEIAATPRAELDRMGARGREVLEGSYSAKALAGRFCELMAGLGK